MKASDDKCMEWIKTQAALGKLYVHDFKNPISALSANLSYIEAVLDNADDDVKGAVNDSVVAVKMLLHMVDNFLLISRLEANEVLESAVISLDQFVSDSLEICQSLFTISEPKLTLENKVEARMCVWPLAYAKLAFENLVLSSMHNTPSKGTVRIEISVIENKVVIIISDDGVKIDAQYFENTFDRDFQIIAKSENNARYGRAMALYAVKLACKVLGGKVEVLPEGQSFKLVLPLEIDLQGV
jgi:signal transduction histidine kinase